MTTQTLQLRPVSSHLLSETSFSLFGVNQDNDTSIKNIKMLMSFSVGELFN